ncbi:MAG TPA: site-2 protease family protein [Blastocatellia bacterium]|nr:site-2 protease family protein [Blastocatellia bacterium]
MRGGLRLGQIFRIDIHVDWSWFFIFLLVTWNLAAGVFPQWHPDWGPMLNWGVAIVASLLFFASVLLHELSHSLVAKARGLPVHRITLFLFGGVSNIEREPPSPRTEFLMAIVGPVTSIVLGIIFLFLANASLVASGSIVDDPIELLSRMGPLSTLLMWLGPINILVGLFNLIPGFPLDGGRVLRSILWGITGNLRRATRWASGAGQVIGWLFIITGIAMVFGVSVPIFGAGIIGGLWLAFIGWFLNNAAVASYNQLVIQDLLEDIPVSRLMRSDIPAVAPDLPVTSLVYDLIINSDEHAYVVMEQDRMVGIVCVDDVRKTPREAWEISTVAQIMTPADRMAVATPDEDASKALSDLARRDVRQLPVIDNGRLVGLLRRRDIVRWLQMQSDFAFD